MSGRLPEGAPLPTKLRHVGRRLVEEWSHDRVPDLAAGVAFYAVLSLLPAFLALAALLGVLESIVGGDVAARAQTEVLDFLGSILTSEADGTLETAEELFTESRPGLLTFSLAAAIWTVSRAFAGLVRALDAVYDLDDHRSWFAIRGTALALSIGSVLAAAIMLTMLVVGPLFGTGEEIAAEIGLGDQFVFLWDQVRLPLAFVVLVAWAATIFHIAPDHHTPWRWDLPGALLTAVLWVGFSGGLRLYLEIAATGNAVFGALGGVLIVLLWFWVLSLAVLVGGELNEVVLEVWGDAEDPVEAVAGALADPVDVGEPTLTGVVRIDAVGDGTDPDGEEPGAELREAGRPAAGDPDDDAAAQRDAPVDGAELRR